VLALVGCGGDDDDASAGNRFDVDRAMDLVDQQVAVGQRPAGSAQLYALADRLRGMLPDGSFEPFPSSGPQQGLKNIVGVIPGRAPAILIGAHYDTEYHPPGFVGANDSAAGTAGVIELARTLPSELPDDHREIRFVLFDGEEEGPGCPNSQFATCALRGSRAYAAAHPGEIGDMILLDYIANEGARITREGNSNPALWAKLRQAADQVGAGEIFPPGAPRFVIIDDHIPFVEQGVPAIDLIDFSYRYADTVEDTPDKLDPAVFDAVGETVAQLTINLSGS
jgi:Zn-dependent M28 family amino/carboxypeptidase